VGLRCDFGETVGVLLHLGGNVGTFLRISFLLNAEVAPKILLSFVGEAFDVVAK